MMQQHFLVSRSGGANSRVMIHLRGCNFYWLLNTECSVEILGCYCLTDTLVDLQQLEGVVEDGTSLKLNEQLMPAAEVQSTSSTNPSFKDRSTWHLAAHGLWWFLTFYKPAEADKFMMRDSIYGQTSTHNMLWP